MSSPLFRQEVAAARRDAWLGEARLAQPLPIQLVAGICVAMLIAFVLYVTFGVYTRRVHAEGLLTPNVGLITIASPAAGRVLSSGVKEGDKVGKGQLLYTISLDAVSSSGPTQERVIEQLGRQRDSVEQQRALRAATAATEKRSLAEQIENLESQSSQLAEQIELQDKLVTPLKDRVDVLVKALSDGLARAADLQNQNYLFMQASSQLSQFKQARLQLEGKLSELKAQHATFDDNLSRDLAEMDRAAAQLEQQRAESEARRGIEVRAPENGTLTSIRALAGQSVAAGAPLLTLLPTEGRLQANLFVDSSSIGFIETGAVVMLRYAAFPFQRFGLHRGVVVEVTRAPLAGDDAPGAPPKGEGAAAQGGLYRIIVEPDENSVMAYGERRRLEAGMKVDADIALETRSLYRWLLDPLYHAKRSLDLVTEGG
ncbi:HlyD family efflux transporter periplasmic adaptor subunit [Methylopila sp. 73B]|uniref:HlyD family secretion protein n=1 Tax=Methylopila sp. 73B TaxID=1120792 RepID=UPI000369D1AF|nr:HlyD family efflux transporter periplasmic adaptor subunit [Methylopila sp. 73B]